MVETARGPGEVGTEQPAPHGGVLESVSAVERPADFDPSADHEHPGEPEPPPGFAWPPSALSFQVAHSAPAMEDSSQLVAEFVPVTPPGAAPTARAELRPAVDPQGADELWAQIKAPSGQLTAAPAGQPPATPVRTRPVTRRSPWTLVAAAAVALLVAGLMVVLWQRPACCGDLVPLPQILPGAGVSVLGERPTPSPVKASGQPQPPGARPTYTAPASGASGAGATAVPAPAPSASQPVVSTRLRASYRTTSTDLLGVTGYGGEVTLTNPGTSTVTDWTVSLELGNGNRVMSAAGASYLQMRTTVVFIIGGTGNTVPAGGVTTFAFEVSGLLAAEPTNCTVNDLPCD